MNPHQITLRQLIAGIRRRLTAQRVLRGVAITLAVATVSVIAASLLAPAVGHRRWIMAAFRMGAAVLTLASLIWLVIRPLRRRVSDSQIARLVEDRYGLQERLVSSIEFSDNMRGASPAIFDRLLDDTGKRCATVDPDRVVDIKKSWAFGAIALLSPLTLAVLLLFGPASVSNEIAHLLTPFGRAASANAMFIAVDPGDSLVPRGLDEQIKAALHGFDSDQAQIFIRKSGESEWIGSLMEPARKDGEFQFSIFNIQNSVSYYIESGTIRSPEFSLTVSDLPFVKQLDLTLNFPAYTHIEPKKIEKGGEVAALKGTVVKLDAYLNGEARAARIVLSDGTNAEMTLTEPGHFTGQFTIKQDGTYHIEITSKDGQRYNGTNEYDINAVEDHPPTVIIDKPGRDAKVTSVEEVFTQVRAEDDYGISSIELFYTVNGGDEQHIVLQDLKSEGPKNLTGTHTFYLEEMGLKPGDFVSYYAKAKDNNVVSGAQEASSDIYFMEVRPFDRQFRQSQQNGGGDGDNDSNMLANRERQIIAATFRVQREESTYTESQKNENYDTVRLSQEKLKADADSLVDRIKRRLGDDLSKSPDYQKLTQNLTDASTEMAGAISKLGERKAKDALQPEQKALQKLIQAQGIFKEIQVAQSKGGQGQQNNDQDLADLFELQLDKMKNQYESVQRQQTAQQNQQQDELAERLKELAARQQKQLEQQMRSEMQSQGGGGGSSPRNQQQLIDEARKMARELEKLSRDEQDDKLQQAAQQLQQAADQMQQAQNGAGSPSSRNQSVAASLRALSLMQQAQRLMDSAKQNGGQQSISSLRQKAQDALNRQSEIEKAEDQLAKQGGSGQSLEDKKQQLQGKKDALANSVSGLANDIEQTARQLGQSGKESTDKLRSASDEITRNNLPERIRDSGEMVRNGKIDQARAGDRQIHSSLQNVLKSLQAAQENRAGAAGKENGLEAALNQARELEEGLDSLARKLEAQNGNQARANQQGQQQGQQGQQQGQQGQQQGQQGQQQGQQGQQGQQQGRQGQQGERGQGQQPGEQGQQPSSASGQQQGNGQRQGASGRQGSQQQSGQRQQRGSQRQSGSPQGQQSGSQSREGQQSSGQQGSQASGQRSNQAGNAQSQNGGQNQSNTGERQGQGRSSQQSNAQGPQAGGREDGSPAGGIPGGSPQELSNAGAIEPISPQDLQSELKERLQEAERLRKALEPYKGLGQDMDKVLGSLNGVNANNVTDPNQLSALRKDALESLREIELELARRLQDQLGSGMGGAIGEGQAPERYRKVIEDYYKRLSQRSAPQQ